VHEADRVRGGQTLAGLQVHPHAVTPRPRLLLPPLAERLPRHELHGDEPLPLGLAHLVHVHDVGMGELGERLGFSLQAQGMAFRCLGVQELDGDRTIEGLVVGLEHRAHAALTELAEHEIAVEGATAQRGRLSR
jgi:hypothetical protein